MPSTLAKLTAILSERLPEEEFQALMPELMNALRDGSVAISGDATGAVTITGNHNVVGDNNRVVINQGIDPKELVEIIHGFIHKNRPFKPTLPYKGLKIFDLDDEHLFFGRAQFLNDLVNELKQTNLILLLGASGSGKSSVVRAGLIPLLKSKWESPGFNLIFKPDLDPFESLYGCLLNKYTQPEAKIAKEGKANTLMRTIETLKPPDTQWLIFIDQFEELFTRSQPEKRKNFIAGLTELASNNNDSSVKIIATMRVDFLDRLSPYRAFEKATQKHRPIITDMQPDELRLAIEQPAAHHGVVFEPDLVAEIIKDVQGLQGQKVYLPLLQFTLELLWNEEIKTDKIVHDRKLNTATYRKLGGVRGALQQHVDKVYKEELSEPEQLAAKQIFLRIVGIAENPEYGTAWQPVRRRVSRSEFDGELKQAVVNKLIDKRLLISNRENGSQDATVEIVHEILFTSWTMLSDWIQESRQNIVIRNDVRNYINRWKAKKSTDELLTGSRLEKALELKKDKDSVFNQVLDGFNEEENKFINISQRRRDRQRYRTIALATLVSTLALLSATLFIVFGTDSLAKFLNNWGREEFKIGKEEFKREKIVNALNMYTTAIILYKNHVEFFMNRGEAYEVLENFDEARINYEAAMEMNPNYADAYNSLARLYILTKTDYNVAAELLTSGLNLKERRGLNNVDKQAYKNAKYAMHKNLGWAQFQLADINNNAQINLENAKTNLMKAIELEYDRKSAHCLLAQVLTAKKSKINAINEWKSCINIPGDRRLPPEEKEWIELAKEHLKIN
jgi:tetratricopeptide (TPR) repeat protein/energy-coupling factor transporter ATP-binding protein EcfA2